MATIAQATGFEIPDINSYGNPAGTSPTISTAHPRHGASALKCAASAATCTITMSNTNTKFGWSAVTRTSNRVGVYFTTFPGSRRTFIRGSIAAGNFDIEIDSSGTLTAIVGTGARQTFGTALVTGRYYVLEFEIDTSVSSAWVLRWRVDNVAQTNATFTGSATTPNLASIIFGIGTSDTFEIHYDDWAMSTTSGDYPIGNGYNLAYKVNASGTHVITTGAFQDDAAAAITGADTTSHTKLEEAAPDSTSWVKQSTGKNSDYLDYAIANTSGVPAGDTPQFVRGLIYTSTAAGGAADGTAKLHDTTDTNIGTTASTTFNYREGRLSTRAGGAGAWTTAAIDALTFRVGFAAAVTNSVRLSYAILEVDYSTSYAITDNESYAGSVTPSGTLGKEIDSTKAGTVTPAGALTKGTSESEAGTVTPAGALTKSVSPHEAGTLTPAGSLAGTTQRGFTGTLTPAGHLAGETDRSFAGTLTPTGVLHKEVDVFESGSLTPAGIVSFDFEGSMTGTLTTTGEFGPTTVDVHFGGTITPIGFLPVVASPGYYSGGLFPRGGSPLYGVDPAHTLLDAYGTIIKEIDKTLRGRCTPTVIGRLSGTGLPGDPGGVGTPGPGDGTGSGTGDITLTDCPCIITLGPGGGLTIVVGTPHQAVRARNLLGCGTYMVFATTRGGREIVVEIPWTALNWGRILGDTSESKTQADGVSGASASCAHGLSLLRPWKHEIAIYRSSYLVWQGPIVKLDVKEDQLTIEARDLSAWLDRRRIRHSISMYADLSAIFEAYVEDAMAADSSPRMLLDSSTSGVKGQRSVLASQHVLAGPLLRELARTGVDWTVVKRELRFGRAITPTIPIALFTDDSYASQPDVSVEGLDQGNDVIVAGDSTGEAGDVVYGAASSTASEVEYGLLDVVDRESRIEDAASATAAAISRLALASSTPAVINGGPLNPFSPILISQLVPGVLIDNRLSRSVYPVAGKYRLSRLDVSAGNDGSEAVGVTFQPVGSVV